MGIYLRFSHALFLCVFAMQMAQGTLFNQNLQNCTDIQVESVVDHLMHTWAYTQDLNEMSTQYSSYDYGLCVYTVFGMLASLKEIVRIQVQRVVCDEDRGYLVNLAQRLELECAQLRISGSQASFFKHYFNKIYRLLQSNDSRWSTGKH